MYRYTGTLRANRQALPRFVPEADEAAVRLDVVVQVVIENTT